MRTFVLEDGRVLEGLGDPVGEARIANRTLASWQDEVLGKPTRIRSLDEIPDGECVIVRSHVFLTRRLLRRFVEAARKSGARTAQLALEPCVFARSTTALTDVRKDGERTLYAVFWSAARPANLETATPVALAVREHEIPNDMLERRGVKVEGMDVALTTCAVLHIDHWSHLVVANYVALFCIWFELTPRKILRYLWAVLRAIWPSRWRIARKLTRRGRRCKIHPTAVVETSILGDDVEICAGAVVRGSILGNGVKIDVHANVNNSSIGDHAVVSFGTLASLVVMYPESMVAQIGAQMTVIGRRATVLSGAFMMDLRDPYLERDVAVMRHGQRVPSGLKVLGPCIGHEAIIAAGVTLAPGLCVPAGAYLVTDPERVIRRIDGTPEAKVPHTARGGGIGPARKG